MSKQYAVVIVNAGLTIALNKYLEQNPLWKVAMVAPVGTQATLVIFDTVT